MQLKSQSLCVITPVEYKQESLQGSQNFTLLTFTIDCKANEMLKALLFVFYQT